MNVDVNDIERNMLYNKIKSIYCLKICQRVHRMGITLVLHIIHEFVTDYSIQITYHLPPYFKGLN